MTDATADAQTDVAGVPPAVRPDVDAIVLDIDDTLYLERDYVRSGFEAVGRWATDELGLEGFGDKAWAVFQAGTRGRIFDEVLRSFGRPSDVSVVAEMVERYRGHSPAIDLAPDARDALDRWHGTTALAAITDGPLASQQAKARALRLDEWIPVIVFTAALGRGKGKPHPAAFELVQERLEVSGARCAYIADNPNKDFIAPKRLGWHTVRIRRPRGLHLLTVGGPDIDYEITSLNQILRPHERERAAEAAGDWS